jgi:Na+/H+ antiporter NhaC
MNWAAPATYIMIALVLGVAFLLGRGMWREFREAYRKDEKEKTNKHIKGKLTEYGIVLAVGLVALIAISYLKVGVFAGISERLWGKPPPTIDSPFHQLGK